MAALERAVGTFDEQDLPVRSIHVASRSAG